MTDDQGKLRISNADRDQAMERLQEALNEGRIDLGEFDERTKSALEAKTNAELDLIFDDLPRNRAEDKSVNTIDLTPEERADREAAARQRVECDGDGSFGSLPALRALIWVGGITTAIWLVSFIAGGNSGYFWPIWPILGLAIATCMQWMGRRRGN